jgi:hypothetical protein
VRIDAWSGSDVQVRLATLGHDGKRLFYRFTFSAADHTLALLDFTVACCRFPPRGDPFAIPLPESLLRALFPDF